MTEDALTTDRKPVALGPAVLAVAGVLGFFAFILHNITSTL